MIKFWAGRLAGIFLESKNVHFTTVADWGGGDAAGIPPKKKKIMINYKFIDYGCCCCFITILYQNASNKA